MATQPIVIKSKLESRTFGLSTIEGTLYWSNAQCTGNFNCRCDADHTYTRRRCERHLNVNEALLESCSTCLRYGLCLKPLYMWEVVGVRANDNSWWIKLEKDGRNIHPILQRHQLPCYQDQCLCGKKINGDNFIILSITFTDGRGVIRPPAIHLAVVGNCCFSLLGQHLNPICFGCHQPILNLTNNCLCTSCISHGWHDCPRCYSILAPEERMMCECQDPSHIM